MKLLFTTGALALLVLGHAIAAPPARPETAPTIATLAGSWTLVSADVLHPDGSLSRDYGASPKGLMLIDSHGRYAAQIYKSERPAFASPDKQNATADELRAAVLGSSCHFGTLEVDPASPSLIYHIDGSAFPNWEGTRQVRRFELHGDELSYRVPPRPDGNVPVTTWRRLK